MPLPRHKAAKANKLTRSAGKGWKHLKMEDLVNFEAGLEKKFHRTPHEFQRDAIKAQLTGKDVLVHAGTGSGKTFIAAGPHAHKATEGMVSFVVSPLIALQEEQVSTFRDEFGLSATAVNSTHGGCTEEVMADICKGKWQIVLISPEIILSKRFVKKVLKNPEIAPRILSIVIDEAHVVSLWGAGFRKQYGTLGMLRAFVPKGTPFVAMSATLSPRVRKEVLSKLQFPSEYVDINLGNDRPNVSIVVRAIQNPLNTYSDLDFLIPEGVTRAEDIKKTFLYVDNITNQTDLEERLYSRLPASFRNLNIIRPYSAAFTSEHRAEVMAQFKAGIIRILVCTDAAGMGCNIPDVDIVVQWKLPSSVSTFVQRAGRAARGPGRTGLAVLLVEKSVYEADLSKLEESLSASESKKKKSVRQSSTYKKADDSKQYAIDHGVLRGSFGGESDNTGLKVEVAKDFGSLDEGLYTLAQTGTCRRKVLTAVYGNAVPRPTVSCCDLCDITLLHRTRPAPPTTAQRASALKFGVPNEMVRSKLEDWCWNILARDFPGALFGPSGILNDDIIGKLSSVGPISRLAVLERIVGSQWPWFARYGDELLDLLQNIPIPPMIPKPPQSKPAKRRLDEEDDVSQAAGVQAATNAPKAKRGRVEKKSTTSTRRNGQNPTPTISTPATSSIRPAALLVVM